MIARKTSLTSMSDNLPHSRCTCTWLNTAVRFDICMRGVIVGVEPISIYSGLLILFDSIFDGEMKRALSLSLLGGRTTRALENVPLYLHMT